MWTHKGAAGIDPDEGRGEPAAYQAGPRNRPGLRANPLRLTSSHELACPCVGLISGISADEEFITLRLSYE